MFILYRKYASANLERERERKTDRFGSTIVLVQSQATFDYWCNACLISELSFADTQTDGHYVLSPDAGGGVDTQTDENADTLALIYL